MIWAQPSQVLLSEHYSWAVPQSRVINSHLCVGAHITLVTDSTEVMGEQSQCLRNPVAKHYLKQG